MDLVETGNGVRQAAAELSAREVPFHEIPVIDFGAMLGGDPAAKQVVADALREAATKVGFFHNKNHGGREEIIKAMFDAGPAFFALPLEEKMKVHVKTSTNNSGYTPLLEENVNPKAKGDLHEAYDIAAELPPDDPALAEGKGLYGVNIWPEGMPAFRAIRKWRVEAGFYLYRRHCGRDSRGVRQSTRR